MRAEIAAALSDPRHALVGGAGDVLGPWQLEALQRVGTLPHHRTLDLGCGTLRGGLCIADYLEPSCYFGVEPNTDLLAVAHELARSAGLNKRISLAGLESLGTPTMFDRVLTQSVLNHLDHDGIEQTVSRVASVLAPDGWWLGTAQFDDAADPVLLGATHPRRRGEWVSSHINEQWFASLLASKGLCLARMPDIPHPRGLVTFLARRALADQAVALLGALVSLDTSAGGTGVGATVDLLCARLAAIGFELEAIADPGGSPLIVARRAATGGGRGRVVLYNHYDAVGEAAELIERDGRLFGPGVGDNKGPLAARLVALERAPRTPAIVWLIQGQEESGSAIARGAFTRLLGEATADIFVDEAGWHDADGTQRVLACTIDHRGAPVPPDARLSALLDFLHAASPASMRTETRTLDKRLVPGGCAFRAALPSGARYLSIGPLDSQTRIHSPDESIARALLEPAMTQFIDLLRWVAA